MTASALVSAALKADSVPERALLRAEEVDVFALSGAADGEIAGVLNRPGFARAIPLARRQRVLEILCRAAVWFEPIVRVTDCRDPKDNKYLELALAAGSETIVVDDQLQTTAPGIWALGDCNGKGAFTQPSPIKGEGFTRSCMARLFARH